MTPVRVVLAAAAVAVAAGLVLTLSAAEPRLAGSNLLPAPGFAAVVPPGQTLCQEGELLPAGAAFVYLTGEVDGPAGPVRLEARAEGKVVAAGQLEQVVSGPLAIPVKRVRETRPGVELCLTSSGEREIRLAGAGTGPDIAARVDGVLQGGRARVEYLRAGEESLAAMLPTAAHRAGLGKASWLGWWTLPLSALLFAGAVVVSCRLLLGEERR